MNKKLLGTLLAVPVIGMGASVALAHEQDPADALFTMSDADVAYFDQVNKIITDVDWEQLSDKQINEKLVASGLEAMFDGKDPLYEIAPNDIEKMSDEQWAQVDAKHKEIYGDEDGQLIGSLLDHKDEIVRDMQATLNEVEDSISSKDLKTLKSLIATVKNAKTEIEIEESLDVMFNVAYAHSYEAGVNEVEIPVELSKEDIEYFNHLDSVISESDWDTLSAKQIDEKLAAAGIEVAPDTQDPLYDMTPAQIEALTDKEWEAIDAQLAATNSDKTQK